jgi:hypothetical protein
VRRLPRGGYRDGFRLLASLVAGGGLGGVFTAWQTYLLIVLGPLFFFLLQKTMQAGRLVASQPALTLANPIKEDQMAALAFQPGW